jgi:three-Cys-motif partner protein
MGGYSFFDESSEQSRIKAEIVAKYLWAWAKVVIPTTKKRDNRIAYIDLFAGPGRYKDGTKSTPLLVLEKAIDDPDMCEMLVSIYSDADPENVESLQQIIGTIPNIDKLKHKPKVYSEIVDEKITEIFESTSLIPSLTFLDPWGYKGLSCRLVNSVIKDWGCDCIIFFNYNRINMGLGNTSVEEHMNALFGQESAEKLREELSTLTPSERELKILDTLSGTLEELGGKYVLPFRFRGGRGNRISHHLIFVTKHVRGYDIMKGVMAKASSSSQQGVPSFEYAPVKGTQPYLLPPYLPLDQLKLELLDCFAGQYLSVLDIFTRHNVGTYYIMPNYKQALLELEEQNRISTEPPADKRRKSTIADRVIITFPQKE